MSFTIVETENDRFWASYSPLQRGFRAMKDLRDRQFYAQILQSVGLPIDQAIMVYRMQPTDANEARIASGVSTPGFTPTLVAPLRAADLELSGPCPFSRWPQRQGDPNVRNAVGSAYPPLVPDLADVMARWKDDTGTYELLLSVAQPGPDPTYYADWSLDGMIRLWVRTA